MKLQTKFKQTEIGKIPEGWGVYKLDDFIEINPKRNLEKGSKSKCVSMQNLKEFNKNIHLILQYLIFLNLNHLLM